MSCQRYLPTACIYMLTIPTECERLGLVHTIVYIKLPIALAYGTLAIYSCSSLLSGDISALSFRCEASEVFTSFELSCTPKHYNTFSDIAFESNKAYLLLCLFISIPRTFLASPKSFISNS